VTGVQTCALPILGVSFFLRISGLNEQRKMAIPLYRPEIIEPWDFHWRKNKITRIHTHRFD